MKKLSAYLAIFAFICVVPVLATAADVAVTLSISNPQLKVGEAPRFEVSVRAISSRVKILKFTARSDLKDTYTRVTILSDGKKIQTSSVISDPGPIGAADYLELVAGQSVTFQHDGMPSVLSRLPVGQYSATIEVWSDWNSESVTSNAVSFRVR